MIVSLALGGSYARLLAQWLSFSLPTLRVQSDTEKPLWVYFDIISLYLSLWFHLCICVWVCVLLSLSAKPIFNNVLEKLCSDCQLVTSSKKSNAWKHNKSLNIVIDCFNMKIKLDSQVFIDALVIINVHLVNSSKCFAFTFCILVFIYPQYCVLVVSCFVLLLK